MAYFNISIAEVICTKLNTTNTAQITLWRQPRFYCLLSRVTNSLHSQQQHATHRAKRKMPHVWHFSLFFLPRNMWFLRHHGCHHVFSLKIDHFSSSRQFSHGIAITLTCCICIKQNDYSSSYFEEQKHYAISLY